MDRRTFTSTVTLGVLYAPLVAEAQQAGKVPRIGWLGGPTRESAEPFVQEFQRVLKDLGWVEGQNIVIEWRFAGRRAERLPDLAAELARVIPSVNLLELNSKLQSRQTLSENDRAFLEGAPRRAQPRHQRREIMELLEQRRMNREAARKYLYRRLQSGQTLQGMLCPPSSPPSPIDVVSEVFPARAPAKEKKEKKG